MLLSVNVVVDVVGCCFSYCFVPALALVWSLLHTGASARAVAPQSGQNNVTQR